MKAVVEKHAITLIREKARVIQLTQRQIAAQLKVSLPTVKRWWAGKGINLTVLSELCSLTGLNLSQLFLQIECLDLKYTYTLQQESMLVAHPRTLALFDLLIGGTDIKALQKKFSLKEGQLFSMLLQLDRVGLIELHEKGRIKLKQRGEPQWIVDGPLSRKYRRPMIDRFLGEHAKSEMSFYLHDYLPEDVVLLKGKIRELENLMLTFNSRGSLKPNLAVSYGAYISLKEFEWDLRDLLTKK